MESQEIQLYNEAYIQGRKALFNGQGMFQNPYTEPLAARAWEAGYNDAAEEKLEAEYHGKISTDKRPL